MELRVLGPVAVAGAEGETVLGRTREAAIIADLVVHAGRVVASARLIDDVWGGHAPPGAAATLQTYVRNVRRLLGPGAITTCRPGYRLDVASDGIDSACFERLHRDGRAALDGNDLDVAQESLDAALDLWRGSAFGELATEPYLQGEAARLNELRLVATEDRVEVVLRAGGHHRLCAELEGLVVAHPYRERLWGQWMLALYRSGRQAEALRAFQRVRRQLAEELGIEPSAALCALEEAILLQKPELDWVPASGASPALPRPGRHAGTPSSAAVPLPARLGIRPTTRLVGRDAQLSAIADAFTRVAAAEGREMFLISGEAGLGKSTLVAEAARVAFERGACVLFGHCEEGLAAPYQLLSEALDHFVTHAPEAALVNYVNAHGSELSRLAPALSSRLPGLAPSKATEADTERYQLFAAVVGLLVMMSQDQPIVIALDDLQWADDASLQLLRHIAATNQPMRLLILASYRDSELARSHPLLDTLAELLRQQPVAHIELRGLDDTAVVSLMEAAAGHALDDSGTRLAHALHRETDGNPFFVTEVLRHLTETGAIYQDATGRWVTANTVEQLTLPESVRVVIGARVGRLGPQAGRVLAMAAVIGRDFDLDVLGRASETAEDELLDILDGAAAAALVRELTDTPGHFSFAHALIQHTLYQELGLTRQARTHRRVAEALEDLFGDQPGSRVGELARHWLSTNNVTDRAKALAYTRRAADSALRSLAPADALRYYNQALDLYEQADGADPLLGIDLAIGLGTAQRQTGDPAFRATLLDAARRAAEVGDTERLVAATLANDRGLFSTGGTIDADKIELLEMALERLAPQDPDRALVLANLCSEIAYGSPLERRLALAEEAIALARSLGSDATIVCVLNNISWPLLVPPLLEQSLAWSADALERAERVGDPVLLFWAAQARAQAAARAGDVDEMRRCYDTVGSLAGQLDQPMFNWTHGFNCAVRAQLAGDIDQTERWATKAHDIGLAGGQPDATLFFGVQMIAANFDRGTLGELIPLMEQSVADVPDTAAMMAPALASAHVEAGRLDAARRALEAFAATDFYYVMDTIWMCVMAQYADVAIACRDPKYAGPLFDRLAPYADQVTTTGGLRIFCSVSHYLGGLATVLGRYGEADAYFAHAAAFNDRAHAKAHAARNNLLWGSMLAERDAPGDNERARDLLTEAQAAAAAHGYANIERGAAQALQHLR